MARFLEAKGMISTALEVATDEDYRWGTKGCRPPGHTPCVTFAL